MKTDTPETDAEHERICEAFCHGSNDYYKIFEFAKKLERERDEAIRSCHIWQKGHSDLVKDRDEWKEEAERWRNVNINVSKLEEDAGLLDRENLALRVKWVNALRAIVGATMPKNKSGMSLVSDIDLILASDEQRLAALEKIK